MAGEEESARIKALIDDWPNREALLLTALRGFTGEALKEENIPSIISVGLVPKLIDLVKKTVPKTTAIWSLIVLVNIAIQPISHQALLDAGALEAALELIKYLKHNNNNEELDCGLSAAFLICRTVGKK